MTDDLRRGRQRSQTLWTSAPAGGVFLAIFRGEITFASGESGAFAGVETIDGTDEDAFRGTMMVTLADGSVSSQSFEGCVLARESATRLSGTGDWAFLDGTGRFAGLTGGGTFRWRLDGNDYEAEFAG